MAPSPSAAPPVSFAISSSVSEAKAGSDPLRPLQSLPSS
jgi:hypothetical protein